MTGAANTKAPQRTEVGLVLQGGGALGAYEYGGITALFDLIDEAVGSGQESRSRRHRRLDRSHQRGLRGRRGRPADARARLDALWNDFMIVAALLAGAGNRDLALFNVRIFTPSGPTC